MSIKWFVPEIHEEASLRVLDSAVELYAPDLIYAEMGNVLWKKWRRKELSGEDVSGIMQDFMAITFQIHKSFDLSADALDIAKEHNQTFYDCIYVALALSAECALITADNKLYKAFHKSNLKKHILWIEDIP